MARPLRIEYPGAVSPVSAQGHNRQAIFTDDRDRTTYLQQLGHYCTEKEVNLLCYCLLSNHLCRPGAHLTKIFLYTASTVICGLTSREMAGANC